MLAVILLNFFHPLCMAQPRSAEISAGTLQDKIRGGLLGHLLGDLNGLPHEMKYIDEPGIVKEYIPALPDGAWTDDDTDFEWVYLRAMHQRHRILLSPGEICPLWKKHINRYFWCANQYARQLMDIGIEPPRPRSKCYEEKVPYQTAGQILVGLLDIAHFCRILDDCG